MARPPRSPRIHTSRWRSRWALPLLAAAAGMGSVSGPAAASGPGAPASSVFVVAGTGRPGSGTGPALRAALDGPSAVAVGPGGAVVIADTGNCRVVEVPGALVSPGPPAPGGKVRVVAGDGCAGPAGPAGAPATRAQIGAVQGVALDAAGDLFIADTPGDRVLEVPASTTTRLGVTMAAGHLYTVAGEGAPAAPDGAGPNGTPGLDGPQGLAVDPAGDLFIADTGHCEVREVPAHSGTQFGVPMVAGGLFTVAGSGRCGTIAGASVATGDGGPALQAVLWTPSAVALGPSGDLVIADRGNDSVRVVAAAAGTFYGVPVAADDIATVAGSGAGYGPYLVDGLSATGPTAGLNFVSGVAVDGQGDLFIADLYDRAVREVAGSSGTSFGRSVTTGDLYTLVGAVPAGATGDGTRWVASRVTYPSGVAVAPDGEVVFADRGANLVRVVVPPGS